MKISKIVKSNDWDYYVRLYSSTRHLIERYGELVLETGHRSEISKDIEVEVALRRDDIAYVEVTDVKKGNVETFYNFKGTGT